MSDTQRPALTQDQQRAVERARELAGAGPDALLKATGGAGHSNLAYGYAVATGALQENIRVLLAVIGDLTGGTS